MIWKVCSIMCGLIRDDNIRVISLCLEDTERFRQTIGEIEEARVD